MTKEFVFIFDISIPTYKQYPASKYEINDLLKIII